MNTHKQQQREAIRDRAAQVLRDRCESYAG